MLTRSIMARCALQDEILSLLASTPRTTLLTTSDLYYVFGVSYKELELARWRLLPEIEPDHLGWRLASYQ